MYSSESKLLLWRNHHLHLQGHRVSQEKTCMKQAASRVVWKGQDLNRLWGNFKPISLLVLTLPEKNVLTSSYFSFSNLFYKQTIGVVMGLLVFPVITNFFMKLLELMALKQAPHKPLCCFCYVDNTLSSGPVDWTSQMTSLTTCTVSTRTFSLPWR